jgi:hypothetical protein
MHRAEVKYAVLLAIAHPAMPLTRDPLRSPGARALEALLTGDLPAARTALAGTDEAGRHRLREAALGLARLAGADSADAGS